MEIKEEVGKVIEVFNQKAKVQIKRSDACESCSVGGLCKLLGSGYMIMEAENPIGAKVGQEVVVSVHSEDVLKASLILYGIPLISFLIGCFIGNWLNLWGMKNFSTFLCGLFFITLSFLGIKVFSRRYEKQSYKPVITRVF